MSWPYSLIYTVASGDTILAVHHNTEHQNHIDNNIPGSTDDYSASLSQMQITTDPYPAASASLATDLAGELARLRYIIAQITGESNWYVDPDTDISTLAVTQTDVNSVTAALDDGATPAGTAANVNTRFDQIVSQLKLITGGANWYTAPSTTLSALSTANTTNTNSITYLQQNQRNILVNGGMEVWQRGTAFSTPGNETYTADKWIIGASGPTFTVGRESSTIDTGLYSAKVDVTVVGSPARGVFLHQLVENATSYSGKVVTLSARVYCTTATKIRAQIESTSGQTNSSYHGGTGWETITATRTVGSSNTSLDISIGILTSGEVSALTFYVDSVMLVIGSDAPTFVPEDPAIAMARCQRYYEIRSAFGIVNYVGAAGTVYIPITFATEKSGTPTVSLSNGTTSTLSSAAVIGENATGFVVRLISSGAGAVGIGNASPPNASWTATV